MESKKIALLAVAIVAIGIFALPSTVSLFSGQHTWYDLGASVGGASGRNNVPCEKCHAEIEDEMMSGDNGAHRNLTCAMCHRTPFTDYTYAKGHYNIGAGQYPPTPGEEAHAASTVECMHCHGIWHDYGEWDHWSEREYVGEACGRCHGGYGFGPSRGYSDFISAGGFGIEDPAHPPYNTTDTDTGEKAAHKKFVLDAMDDPLMEGANEACIACHTRIGVNITWTKRVYLEFNASEDGAGVWTIPSFTAGGENVTQVNTSNSWTNP